MLLTASNIYKKYGKREIIKGIDFSVMQGETVGILGPNGAGKTTFFYIITGLVMADRGQVLLDGNDITNVPMHIRGQLGIGYLPQEASIFRGMTVEDNILAILEIDNKNKKENQKRVDELLDEFHIRHLRKENAISLSGGERRRLEIARSLALNPKFILLDEPFAGVDPISVEDIINLVSHLKNKNIGVIITDHNVRETLKTVDKVYIIHNGKVLISGTRDKITESEDVKKYYLGTAFL